MAKIYNAEQQQFIHDARTEYCDYVSEIDKQKQYTKELFESLVDKPGIDLKKIKRVSRLYVRDLLYITKIRKMKSSV